MIVVFCSRKLEKLIGSVESNVVPDVENKLGNWNGHLFIVQGKKNLIFTNDKTAYSFVLMDIRKADLKDFNTLFKESLIRQLYNDLLVNERQEIQIRNSLTSIRLTKTNNNKRILGTMNDFIVLIKDVVFQNGPLKEHTNISLGYGVNNHFVGTKLEGSEKNFSVPKELMQRLLKKMGEQ